ncbi:oxidoreductase [Aerococcaceae bacterium DSM 109653]|uniref:Oxidoreductase n=1 Tax=Fundicoccus ignavus TaxID=2664442 RepID=A0A844BN98_9LACT|nr:aldo/keto reductase [Fundicoccus ignavus]MRI82624.1 oxidoreductase [Fundicoccus ignavus]
MEYINLSKDVKLSRVSWGFWRFKEWQGTKSEFINLTEFVLDLGITTMDHADSYGRYTAEEKFGDMLVDRPDLKNRMQFVSKVGLVYPSDYVRVKYYDNSKEYIISQAERSLKNLGIEALDVILLHRPDWFADPTEIAEAFEKLYKDGKIKAIGVSNYLPHEFRKLESYLSMPLSTNQIELSVSNYDNFENGTIDLAVEKRIHPMIWSPLSGGKIFTSDDIRFVELRKILEIIRQEVGAESIDEIAYAWLLSHPAKMIPITGSYIKEYIEKPVSALKYKLTSEQWYMIWTAYKGHRIP